ncbi:MAG TPA: CoA-binding protein [Candidatus Saccharimonadales bacterium]|nr:CoA-binding protein [Candidatus Saccharimonadales bacterium]
MSVREIIEDFLREGPYAVVGASNDRAKFGNRVLRAYQHKDMKVYPVNPREPQIEGLQAYPDLKSLPETPRGVSIITPPAVTERIVAEAADAGATFVWMQPGAESPEAIRIARERGLQVIADGSCFLVETRFRS